MERPRAFLLAVLALAAVVTILPWFIPRARRGLMFALIAALAATACWVSYKNQLHRSLGDFVKSSDNGSRPPFDHALAAELLGKHVLVGITKLDHEDNLIEQIQYHGEVVVADQREGFRFRLLGTRAGEFEWLPPDTRAFTPARPGEYQLRSTGETISNPNYTTTWTSKAPPPG